MNVYNKILEWRENGRKFIIPLIDPDKYNRTSIEVLSNSANVPPIIFVGGSMVTENTENVVADIKSILGQSSDVALFPGDYGQLAQSADALLFLSLVSGRNPEYLIGQHVKAAPIVRRLGIEVIPTAYMLIDGGKITSVQYVSCTMPLPNDKPDLCVATAMAAEMLGLKMIYLEAGSGAQKPVPPHIISSVRKNISIPLIVGGGLRTPEAVNEAFEAGADLVVVGTAFERFPQRLNMFM